MSDQPRFGYTIGLLGAAGIHALILFGITSKETFTPPEFGVEVATTGVEVALVAALPADNVDAVEAVQTPPEEVQPETPPEETPQPEPEPEPVVEPEPPAEPEPVTPPEMAVPKPTPAPTPEAKPTPAKPAATPKPKPNPTPSKPKAAQARTTGNTGSVSGDGSSAIPGNDATTAAAAMGALTAQPGYLRNPHPAYPEEARKAGQQGVVHLRVKLDEKGGIQSVTLSRTSGFPMLDERALTTVREKWRFKPAKRGRNPVASDVVIPIRFTLNK